jgi:hypothetical protein
VGPRKFPFWIVTQSTEHKPPDQEPFDDPKAIHAFTSAKLMVTFLEARESGKFEMSLVADADTLLLAVADSHWAGAKEFCFDAEPDGSGGSLIPLTEVFRWVVDD